MALVNQASKLPTRKVMAVILAGMVVGGIQSALGMFWPDHPFAPYMDELDIWVQGLMMIAAGYLTKEREYAQPMDNTGGMEKHTDSRSGGNSDSLSDLENQIDSKVEIGKQAIEKTKGTNQ